jgi:hypothetical protein
MTLSKKNKYLIFGFVAMVIVSYKLALEKTFVAKRQYAMNMEKQASLSNLPQQLSLLSQKERFLDEQLKELNLGDASMQNNLLKFLNRHAGKNKVKVIDFNSPHVIATENEEIATYIFNLEGGYTQILKTLHSLENNGGFGSVTHVVFEKKKDYRKKRTYLQAEVFLEQVK